ncbi:uncharacterized protein ACR2FA_002727 [Aphomia sociella]
MNSALSSTTKSTSLSDDSSECNIVAKLRRLKIQEGLIIQNIKKSIPNLRDKESSITNINYKTESEYKEFISRIHNTYTEIINLFQSVKTSTSSRENLQTIDIDDVKNNVFELETKLKSFKIFLHSKLTSLKADEQELTKEMHMLTQQTTKTKISHKVSNKCYSDIIPSPVKIIINSPFKYTEVQKFQNFMSNYGRYGGWNEYNHNMFLLCWKKHFYTGKTIPKDMQYYNVKDHSDFISDLFEKNQGKMTSNESKAFNIKKDEIISHIEWYLQYLQLKNRQQKALEKWRDNRRKIKKFHNNLQNRKFKKQEGHSNVTNERICRKKLAEIQLSSDERVSEKTTNDNDILFE